MSLKDAIFIKFLLMKYYLGLSGEKIMMSYSQFVERKMAGESTHTSEVKIPENILDIWEKIQSSEVNKAFPNTLKRYQIEQFIQDLKSL